MYSADSMIEVNANLVMCKIRETLILLYAGVAASAERHFVDTQCSAVPLALAILTAQTDVFRLQQTC